MGTKWTPETKKKKEKDRDRLCDWLEKFRARHNLSIKEMAFVLSPSISEVTYRSLKNKRTLPTPKSLKLLKQAIKMAKSMEDSGHTVKRDNRMIRIQQIQTLEPAEPPEAPKIVSAQAKAEANALKCKAKCSTCWATFELEAGTNVAGTLPSCPCGGKFKLVLGKNGS